MTQLEVTLTPWSQREFTHRRCDGSRAAPLVYDAQVGRAVIDWGVVLQPIVVDLVRRILRGGQRVSHKHSTSQKQGEIPLSLCNRPHAIPKPPRSHHSRP